MPHETYDTLCLRYLRARKFDHEQTVQMLTESIVRAPWAWPAASTRRAGGCSGCLTLVPYPLIPSGLAP